MKQERRRNCEDCNAEIKSGVRKKYCDECSEKRKKKHSYNSSIKRMIRNREFIKECKQDKQCEICGYNKYTEILDFHHKDKKEKIEGVSNLMKTLKNLETIKSEIEKCMVLCPNCHRELHLLENRKIK